MVMNETVFQLISLPSLFHFFFSKSCYLLLVFLYRHVAHNFFYLQYLLHLLAFVKIQSLLNKLEPNSQSFLITGVVSHWPAAFAIHAYVCQHDWLRFRFTNSYNVDIVIVITGRGPYFAHCCQFLLSALRWRSLAQHCDGKISYIAIFSN